MREVGKTLGIPVNVFGNETHMTAIVSMALGKRPIPKEPTVESHTANFLLPGGQNTAVSHYLLTASGIRNLFKECLLS